MDCNALLLLSYKLPALIFIALWASAGMACPWHGEEFGQLPMHLRRPMMLKGASPTTEHSTVSIRLTDHLRGMEKSYVLEESSLTLPTTAGYSCSIDTASVQKRIFILTCEKGGKSESVSHSCSEQNKVPTSWRGYNLDGVNTASVTVHCEAIY